MNATCSEKPPFKTYSTAKVEFNRKRRLVLIKCLTKGDGAHAVLIRVGKGITKGCWEMYQTEHSCGLNHQLDLALPASL